MMINGVNSSSSAFVMLSMPVQVYLAEAGYLMGQAGVPKQAILTSLAGVQVPDLDSFQQVLQGLPAGSRPTLQYFTPTERHRKKSVVLHLDYTWCAQSNIAQLIPSAQYVVHGQQFAFVKMG